MLSLHRRAREILPFEFIVCCGPNLLFRVLLRRWFQQHARLQRRHVCGVRGVCVLQLHRRAREILLFVFIVRCGPILLIRVLLRRRLKRQPRLQRRHVCGIRGLRVLQLPPACDFAAWELISGLLRVQRRLHGAQWRGLPGVRGG